MHFGLIALFDLPWYDLVFVFFLRVEGVEEGGVEGGNFASIKKKMKKKKN